MLPLLIVSSSLACSFQCGGLPREPLHPCEYASTSGEWVLHVEPSERYGAGAAWYAMRHDGVLVWEYGHPFTFQDARVAPDGSVAGHASSTGMPGIGGEVVVAILAPDGTVRGTVHEPYVWRSPARAPYPQVQILELSGDLVSVRVSDAASGEWEQWTFSLSTGGALGRSAAGPRPTTRTVPSSRLARPTITLALDELPQLAHVELGSVRFEDPDVGQELSERDFCFHQVDSDGRVWLFERATSSVHAFEESGNRLIVARPWTSDLGENYAGRQARWIAVREDGGLLVRFLSGLVEFAADGQRIGRTGERDYGAPRLLFQPGRREHWELDQFHGGLFRIDSGGEIVRKIERGASGRWMRRLTQAVVASDGSLALLDASHGLNATDVWFHVFDEVGDAISSVELPSSCQFASLAYDGRRIALQSQKCVIFFGLDGKPRGKVSLDDSAEVLGIAFSPRGELWLVNGDGIRRWCVK